MPSLVAHIRSIRTILELSSDNVPETNIRRIRSISTPAFLQEASRTRSFSTPTALLKEMVNAKRSGKQSINHNNIYQFLDEVKTFRVSNEIMASTSKNNNELHISRYSLYSLKGLYLNIPDRENQDSIFSFEHEDTKSLVLVCMDGHGSHGHDVVKFFQGYFAHSLCRHGSFAHNLHEAISETILIVEKQLLATPSIDCEMSGTTLTMAVIRGNTVTVANVGDSRVVIIRKEKNGVKVLPLTYDHTPELEEERDRILSAGGRVFGVKYPDGTTGPNRIWLAQYDAPGLAMSRSVGDRLVHGVGVISTPTFMEHVIDEDDVAIVVASDGLWNVLSDEEVVKHVMSSRDSSGAVRALLRVARLRWSASSSRNQIDDISVAVAFCHEK